MASKKIKHLSAMSAVAKEGTQEETVRRVLTRSNKSAREHRSVKISDIIFDPADNYRWGTEAGMEADIKTGESAKTYAKLKTSIKEFGVEEPVGLFPCPDDPEGKLRGIYGFNRIKAAMDAGVKEVDAYVYPADISAAERLVLQGRENSVNLKREVNWVRECAYLENLATACGGFDGKVWEKACRVLGKSKGTLSRYYRTCMNVPAVVRKYGEQGMISASVAEQFYAGEDAPSVDPKTGEASADGIKTRFTEKEATAIITEALTKRNKNGEETGSHSVCTAGRIAGAINTYTADNPEVSSRSTGTKIGKPSTANMRDTVAYLISKQVTTSILGDMPDVDDFEETGEAFMIAGILMALGDTTRPDADSVTEAQYEQETRAAVRRAYLSVYAETWLADTDTLIAKEDGEDVEWIEGRTEIDGKKVGNKKHLAGIIDAYSRRETIEVETEKRGKTVEEKVPATLGLLFEALGAELDELVAGAQES